MLDIHRLRTEPDVLVRDLARRGVTLPVAEFSALETIRRDLQVRTQQLQADRNRLSKEFGQRKAKGEETEPLRAEVQNITSNLETQEAALSTLLQKQRDWVAQWPNALHDSVPDGRSSEENVEVHRWGAPPVFSFPPQDHVALGEGLKAMDFEAAARLSGSRFVVLSGPIARLHRALAHFMLDVHTVHHGYREVQVPYLVTAETMFCTGQLPKFSGDFFQIQGRDLLLIPTAESPVTNMVRDQILSTDQLPLRWVCHSPCFRSEAGSYGKDTRGMIRQHQFDKVELVQVVHPDVSFQALESLTRHAESILEQLELPYRRMLLCAGDTGFSAAKTYDLEVWLPGSNAYREISSCSNCTDFQARRMMARYRNAEGKSELVHTLNGSGLAVGRTLVAVLENYQQADGSVKIPKVLQGYLGGQSIISRDAG